MKLRSQTTTNEKPPPRGKRMLQSFDNQIQFSAEKNIRIKTEPSRYRRKNRRNIASKSFTFYVFSSFHFFPQGEYFDRGT